MHRNMLNVGYLVEYQRNPFRLILKEALWGNANISSLLAPCPDYTNTPRFPGFLMQAMVMYMFKFLMRPQGDGGEGGGGGSTGYFQGNTITGPGHC